MQLTTVGWDASHETAFRQLHDQARLAPARIARQDRASYVALTEHGEVTARAGGRVRALGEAPIVGDWVALDDKGNIRAILPRRSCIRRGAAGGHGDQPLAANVDVALIVMGLDNDFSVRRLERYLVLLAGSGARAAVVLNKADAGEDVPARVVVARATSRRVPVLVTSAATGEGVDAVRALLPPGTTGVLLGSSGVGKSTLLNRLAGNEVAVTAEVRAHDDTGRHTTTSRQLHVLPGGGVLLDTPGLREVRLAADAASVDAAFDDVAALAEQCRFRDCQHDTEPGCAVRAELEPARLESYRKLRREAARHERDHAEQRAADRRWGRLHRNVTEGKRRRWD